MYTKQLMIGVLATLLTFGLFGTALGASDQISRHSSEAGVYEFNFDAPLTMAEQAAINHVYDRNVLASVGTESGAWKYRFDAPETSADMAARSHVYDERNLAEIGTEGGVKSRGVQCINC